MSLIKTSILSFFATVVKVAAGLVINKAVSSYIGPSGLALVGQFQNFTQLIMTAGQGAIGSGVVKYTAEYKRENQDQIPVLFSTAGKISLISSIILGVVMVIFSNYLSLLVLKSNDYPYVFKIFGVTLIFFVANNLLLSIINGLMDFKLWLIVNLLQSIYGLIFTTLLITFRGLDGAFIAMVTNQSVVLLVVLWLVRKHRIIKLENFKRAFSRSEAKKLAGFSAMAITSAIVSPISHMWIRNHVGETIGWDSAGYWQAIWYVSSVYLLVGTTVLSTYYLPRLSELTKKEEIRAEVFNGYLIILPVVFLTSLTIYFSRDFIVKTLFAEGFAPMRELFFWQLVGDFIKMAAWLQASLMISKAMKKAFIVSEILFGVSFVVLTILFTERYGLVGVCMAYASNYFLYFVVATYVTKILYSR